ncbi:MAG: class I SAM-dependent methyltransferase [Pyrinomonadaceae bacterium]|nr:class I SAM-dependent methyltransferase [Pyrinomonadaceae bacterium]
MSNFEQKINDLDLSLFERIESQSVDEDKRSLLSCQSAVRELVPKYKYLEIGSYLGGSIQPHLLDDRCAKIYSIDKRPLRQPDERGVDYTYLNNSTERMMELLKDVAPDNMSKITTIDGDTGEISTDEVADKIDLCFIDGEHTDYAALRDFKFCLDVLNENGAILFHDAVITYNGIADCIEYLKKKKIKFRAYNLPAIVFAVEIGDFPMHKNSNVLERLLNNHVGYLFSLQYNDYYRQFANKTPFRMYRKFMIKWKGLNKFE